MSEPKEDFATRRAALAAKIARQRFEFKEAYRNLEKPIHYAEYGMRGFGFIRNNPWIFVATPLAINAVSLLFGLRKKKVAKGSPSQEQTIEGQPRPKGLKQHVTLWTGRAWRLYQIYRKVRSFLP